MSLEENRYIIQDGSEFIIILKPKARLDVTNSWQFRMKIQEYISQTRCHIIINFSQVKFIDNIGLSSLIAGMQHTQRLKKNFSICNLNSLIRLIFEMTMMNTVFEIFETEEEALNSFMGSEII